MAAAAEEEQEVSIPLPEAHLEVIRRLNAPEMELYAFAQARTDDWAGRRRGGSCVMRVCVGGGGVFVYVGVCVCMCVVACVGV